MEIKINLDLEGIIANSVTAERIQPLVDKAISDSIKCAIDDATGYRSEFREKLKKQLSEIMPHGLSIDDRAKFQHIANTAITEMVHAENSTTIQTALRSAFKEIMPDIPERIKLSELMQSARNGLHKDPHEAFYAEMEYSNYGGIYLYLDRDDRCSHKYRASIALAFNEDGEAFSLKLDNKQITPKSVPNIITDFEGILLSLYVGRTTLELDIDASEVSCMAQEQYD